MKYVTKSSKMVVLTLLIRVLFTFLFCPKSDGSLGLETPTSPEDSSEIYVTDESFARLSESQMAVQEINEGTETIVGELNNIDT